MSLFRLFIIAFVVAIIGQIVHSAYGQMYEDQIEVCNFEQVCQIVAIDDYMSRDKANKLQSNFNEDLDTYSKIQSLDEECKNNYHAFCFGQAWNSLKDYLN